MSKEYGTIKIPREEYEEHNERRQAMGLSWSEYIDGESPEMGFEVDFSPVLNRIDDLETELSSQHEELQR